MKQPIPKIISLFLLVLLTLHGLWCLLGYWLEKQALSAPYIPAYVGEELARPYLVMGVVTLVCIIPAFWFFARSKYKVALWICVGVLVLQVFVN